MKWRAIITDTEAETGVAPECGGAPHAENPADPWVYDCCPEPFLETYHRAVAAALARTLTTHDVELCE